MLQNIKSDEFYRYIDALWEKFKTKVNFTEFNLCQLNIMIQDFDEFVKLEIPKDLLEEWEFSDYEIYTDKYYHRKFWNEILNPDAVQEIFNKISEVLNADNTEFKYMLCSYDFNDKEMYFKTEKDINDLINKYNVAPCTAFSTENNQYIELWSI